MTPVTRPAPRIRSPTRHIRPDSSSRVMESSAELNFFGGGGAGIECYEVDLLGFIRTYS